MRRLLLAMLVAITGLCSAKGIYIPGYSGPVIKATKANYIDKAKKDIVVRTGLYGTAIINNQATDAIAIQWKFGRASMDVFVSDGAGNPISNGTVQVLIKQKNPATGKREFRIIPPGVGPCPFYESATSLYPGKQCVILVTGENASDRIISASKDKFVDP